TSSTNTSIAWDVGGRKFGGEQGPVESHQEWTNLPPASAIRGRSSGRESVSSRPPAGRFISPVPRETDNIGNMGGAGESSGESEGFGPEFKARLTPAAFKGLASGMRTPSVGMNRAEGLVEK
ncbi:unnamed protein product, partial [Sphacelaria rigidula]